MRAMCRSAKDNVAIEAHLGLALTAMLADTATAVVMIHDAVANRGLRFGHALADSGDNAARFVACNQG